MSFSRAYPNQDIPPNGYYQGFEQHLKMTNSSSAKSVVDPWEAKGPLNTTGRTLTLEVNPEDPNTIYAGSASGGLWRSRSLGAGVSWEYMETGFPVLGVSTIEFAPGDSSVLFIGTGEVYNYNVTGNDGAFRATRGSYGIGILKSLDGGASWSKSLDWSYQNQRGVWMIEISESNSDLIYSATTDGIYKSIDQGESWTKVLDVIMGTDISINPDDENDVVAVCGNFDSPGAGIYRTIDGGVNWQQITSNEIPVGFNGKILIDRSKSNPETLYASIGNGFSGSDGFTWLLRSDDFGQNWTTTSTVDYSKWQGWFAHDVAINPQNPDEIITVGIDIFKSTDGGFDLSQRSTGGVTLGVPEIGEPDGPANYSHSDHHFVKYHPSMPGVVLFGNDGGCFISFDNGESFGSYNGGMQTTQFYNGFSVSETSPDFAMGGLQDNSTSIYTGDGKWRRAIGGDGSWTAINQSTPEIVFGSYQNLNIARSMNSGVDFQFLDLNKPNDEVPLFIAPYISSKAASNIMYAGGKYFYRSNNTGLSWELKSFLGGNPAYSMEGSPVDLNIVYVGTSPLLGASSNLEPEVFVTQDGGDTWTSNTFDLPNRIPNDITTHPTDPGTAYVCFSGFGSNHLFKTDDFGANWTALDQDLPDVPGNAIIVDPKRPKHLYYGNDIGVYFSSDGGQSWSVWGDGLPSACIVMDLKISDSDDAIWVATHGNGTYKRSLEDDVLSIENIVESNIEVELYPNPVLSEFNINILEDNFDTYNLFLYDLSGKLAHKQYLTKGRNTLTLDKLSTGNYQLMISSKDKKFTTKIIKI